MNKLIGEIIIEKNIKIKMKKFIKIKNYIEDIYYHESNSLYTIFNFINVSFNDFFKDYYIINNILTNDKDKTKFINIILNIYKILLNFPNHTGEITITNDGIAQLQAKVNSLKLKDTTANYIDGE